MNVRRVVPDVITQHLEESRGFYVGLFGLEVAMDAGWVVTLVVTGEPDGSGHTHDP